MSTPKRPKRPRDPNQLAHEVFLESIGEKLKAFDNGETPPDPAKEAAIERSRRGGLEGGRKRAEGMTPERRAEIARKAARARWMKAADLGSNTDASGAGERGT